jgi:hypothetical protein
VVDFGTDDAMGEVLGVGVLGYCRRVVVSWC